MAKQISTPVPFPAPVTGVQDPAVRRALQDLIDAHQTRNGQTKERFLTEADIDQLAGRIVFTGLSGSGAGGGGDGGGGGDFFDGIRQTIEDRIFSTKLFKKLSSEIEWLTTANSLSLAKISSLENGFNESRIEVLDGNAILVQETKGLKASIGSNTAAILEERTVRATNDSALVNAINTMFAAVGTNNALIQDGNNLAVNWNAAQADKWSQMQVEVFGADGTPIRTALAQEAQLRVDLEGNIENTWTVRMNADGRWAGFGLGMEGTPGDVTSTFIIAADQFAVVSPGQPGETPRIPFYIGPTNGLMLSAGTEWDKVEGLGKPADFATRNRIFRQSSPPTGAVNGDIWVFTGQAPNIEYVRVGGAWQAAATLGATFDNEIGQITGRITPSNITTYIENLAVNTFQIANNAVSVIASGSTSASLWCPPGRIMNLVGIGFFPGGNAIYSGPGVDTRTCSLGVGSASVYFLNTIGVRMRNQMLVDSGLPEDQVYFSPTTIVQRGTENGGATGRFATVEAFRRPGIDFEGRVVALGFFK